MHETHAYGLGCVHEAPPLLLTSANIGAAETLADTRFTDRSSLRAAAPGRHPVSPCFALVVIEAVFWCYVVFLGAMSFSVSLFGSLSLCLALTLSLSLSFFLSLFLSLSLSLSLPPSLSLSLCGTKLSWWASSFFKTSMCTVIELCNIQIGCVQMQPCC